MGYFSALNKAILDNGLLKGIKIFSLLSCQRLINLPKIHIYEYYCVPLKKTIKIKYTSEIERGFSLIELFGYVPYYKSRKGRLIFSLSSQSTVMDLGAFIGDSSVLFASQGATVYAYEPQQRAYDLILENSKLNKIDKIRSFNFPVTSDGRSIKSNVLNAKIKDNFNINSSILGKESKSIKFIDVLKKEKFWDLVKIDIEGSEWEIMAYLKNYPDNLKKIGGMIIELHSVNQNIRDLMELIKLLENNNFTVETFIGRNLGMLWAKKQ